jgi:hypothetical protein
MTITSEPEWLFPFQFMAVGESFFIPTMQTAPMMYKVTEAAKRVGIKVKVYVTTKEGHLGVRVWRIA